MRCNWKCNTITSNDILKKKKLKVEQTCFCSLRWCSSIFALSISKITGANNIIDELKKIQVAFREKLYMLLTELYDLVTTVHVNRLNSSGNISANPHNLSDNVSSSKSCKINQKT